MPAAARASRWTDYWTHAVTVALLAQRLAPFVTVTPRPSPGDAYLAGLLHSIGLLALVHLFPRAMNDVFRARPANADALMALEREIVGADHCDVGGWLARKWRLPRHIWLWWSATWRAATGASTMCSRA